MLDGHQSRPVLVPGLSGRLRLRALRVAGGLGLANCVFWLLAIAAAAPSPLPAFADRQPAISVTETGVQIDLCHDCSSMVALAGRDFGKPWHEDGWPIAMVVMANPIGLLASSMAIGLLEGAFGYHGAMWVGTVAFLVASSAQWWAVGWLAGYRLTRSQRESDALKSVGV